MGNNITTEEITNYQIAANEFLNRVIMPEGCEIAGKSIHNETVIFDCTNMSLWRKFVCVVLYLFFFFFFVADLKCAYIQHLEFHMSAIYNLKAIAEIVQHYYPETLHRLFIVNAPSAFIVMFKVIKPWLNARVSLKTTLANFTIYSP
jgi:hypothetical protein